ncbi:MAG: DUF4194 domain-containing protein [Spirulina sp. DLM2.Bin59]|nr:MAG: DUF4194 domain-containing protein [Spirulina sp. DLM2.Bin59]
MITMSTPPYASVILKLLQGAIYSDDPHWDRLQSHFSAIQEYFGKIGLEIRNYEIEGLAYLEQPEPDPENPGESLPRLIARHPLSFKLTVFLVLLREQLQQFDISDATGRLVISIEKIRDLFAPYLPDSNNEEKLRRDIDTLVKQAVEFGFLKRLTGDDNNYEVRPILKAKIDATMLENLKAKLITLNASTPGANHE